MSTRYPYLRRLPPFEYLAPTSLAEATALLSQHGSRARVLAGGTDLLLHMKERSETPKYVIGLKGIRGLDYLSFSERQGLIFGPMVTVHTLETHPLIRERYPILAEAASVLGSFQVRNLATAVGNLCSALPSSDMAPSLIVLDASLTVKGPGGERNVPLDGFMTAPGQSALSPEDLVVAVNVPPPPRRNGMVYLKHMQRSAMDLAVVSVAAMVDFRQDLCREARICLGTAGPKPWRASGAEALLKGQPLDSGLIEKAAARAAEECRARSSRRASEEYRREMIKVLTTRALTQIRQNAGV